jgi:hypothetical protein
VISVSVMRRVYNAQRERRAIRQLVPRTFAQRFLYGTRAAWIVCFLDIR